MVGRKRRGPQLSLLVALGLEWETYQPYFYFPSLKPLPLGLAHPSVEGHKAKGGGGGKRAGASTCWIFGPPVIF